LVSVPGGGCVLEVNMNIGGPDVVADDPVDEGSDGDGAGEELSVGEVNAPSGAHSSGIYSGLLTAAESLVTLLLQTGGQG